MGTFSSFDAREFRLLAANARYHVLHEQVWQHGHALGHALAEMLPEAERPVITAIFQKVAQTGVAYHDKEYASTALARGVTYWNWTLDPISERGQVCYLLLIPFLQAEHTHLPVAANIDLTVDNRWLDKS